NVVIKNLLKKGKDGEFLIFLPFLLFFPLFLFPFFFPFFLFLEHETIHLQCWHTIEHAKTILTFLFGGCRE
ncbi:hypothetical protein KEJ28_00550, partial [Candidatus Bathyarchaeota archaeon]|nr:hypothetical protein [Candidatus Bathyarchaeota archaeon]